MSWAGILRPGNEFTPAKKSKLAVLTTDSDIPFRRYFGKWDGVYNRFATNFTSSKIKVEAIAPNEEPSDGIQCILHWVDQKDMIRSDKGSVCYGDGWPKELWDLFTSQLDNLPQGTIAEKLREFLDSNLLEENRFVSLWRSRLRKGTLVDEQKEDLDRYWLPVPATLIIDREKTQCIFSWSPGALFYESLSEALSSFEAIEKKSDYQNQAKYYLECVLGKLHGVKFDSQDDLLQDEEYAHRPEVKGLQDSFTQLERERISDRRFGRLDCFGFSDRSSKTISISTKTAVRIDSGSQKSQLEYNTMGRF